MNEADELIELCVRALVAQMIAAPGVELHVTRTCVLGLTDEPLADFNRLILGAEAGAEEFLIRATARAKERGRPLVATMSPGVAEALGPVAARLGFAKVGSSPLMMLDPDVPVRPGRSLKIVRVLDAQEVAVAGDLIAAAFEETREVIARYIEVGMTPTSGVETYVGYGEDGAMCTVSMTPTGDTGAISLMATPPEHQRKGLGQALLSQMIDDYRRRGMRRFHLGATEAGRALYEGLGFRTVAEAPVWLLAAEGQA